MMTLPIRSQVALAYVLVCIASFLVSSNPTFAQRVILNEDFESYAPDTFPGSADFFAKSSIAVLPADFDNDKDVDGKDFLTWQRGFGVGTTKAQGDANGSGTVDEVDLGIWQDGYGKGDPANVVVTGGAFTDPFDPGNNQSMVLHNPNGTSQMAVTWTNEFEDDPNTFRNGSIEFDVWMDSPDPDAFWTFMSIRIGHGDIDRHGSTASASDTTIWNSFRMQNNPAMGSSDVLEQITDPGHRITFGSESTYIGDNSSPSAGV